MLLAGTSKPVYCTAVTGWRTCSGVYTLLSNLGSQTHNLATVKLCHHRVVYRENIEDVEWELLSTKNTWYVSFCQLPYLAKEWLCVGVGAVKMWAMTFHPVTFISDKSNTSGPESRSEKKYCKWDKSLHSRFMVISESFNSFEAFCAQRNIQLTLVSFLSPS